MASIVDTISKDRVKPEEFTAFVEISKGSKMKYELDEETGLLAVDRILYTSTAYPWNYGLIPLTVAPDGDPLDVLIISSVPIQAGCLAKCRPIGIMRMNDSGDQDDKVLAVMPKDPMFKDFTDIAQLPKHLGEEIQHFFNVYKALEGKKTQTGEIEGPEAAKKTIKDCMDACAAKH
ncbi:inorganic diphosphatase [Methanomassiliicoccales archaeon LGM-DZ1]|nr:inorganic diphosphatase [Methanomassiliicoccales archaeon LGM-DZ1]